jgi:mannose-6-phosphate isomerase-like protein (cupin superfamily)
MQLHNLFEQIITEKKKFVTNIETDSIKNTNFRKVLFTGEDMQVVVMSIEPEGDIGLETHSDTDQFIRVEKGEGKVIMNGKETSISDGTAFVIPQGTEHNVVNTSDTEDLKLYTIYSPPHHPEGTIQKTKPDKD